LMQHSKMMWGVEDVAQIYAGIDVDHLVSLDHPPLPGDDTETRRDKYRRNARYLKRLFDRFGSRIVPVIHGNNEAECRANAAAILEIHADPQLIGLGGLVPHLRRSGHVRSSAPDTPQQRIRTLIHVARDYFPAARIHVFGVGSVRTALGVLALGASSIDSVVWRQAAGFGIVFLPGQPQRILTNRPPERLSRPFLSETDRALLACCRCPVCVSTQPMTSSELSLAESYLPRALHNIYVLYKEVSDMLNARRSGELERFITSRLSPVWSDTILHTGRHLPRAS
jgi:7-cyano-7-deazaguanine tRNA-ribosyltransferase